MSAPMQTIVETTDNRLFSVRDAGDANLDHVWFGYPVKRVRGEYLVPQYAREQTVRKAGSRVVAQVHS